MRCVGAGHGQPGCRLQPQHHGGARSVSVSSCCAAGCCEPAVVRSTPHQLRGAHAHAALPRAACACPPGVQMSPALLPVLVDAMGQDGSLPGPDGEYVATTGACLCVLGSQHASEAARQRGMGHMGSRTARDEPRAPQAAYGWEHRHKPSPASLTAAASRPPSRRCHFLPHIPRAARGL